MRSIGRQQLQDVVLGAGLLGAGGGGSVKEGMKLVDNVLRFTDQITLASPDEVSESAWGAVIAGMGSPKASLNRARLYSPRYALERLEREKGFESGFVIPFELGAGNSLNPMLAAAQKGIPMIDGDPAGRAVPQVDMTTFALEGLSISPFSLATEEDIRVLIESDSAGSIEQVARAITAELGGVTATSGYAMTGADLKRTVVSGTTSFAEKVGAVLRRHGNAGTDPLRELEMSCGAVLLGRGTISAIAGETRGGFDFGRVEIKGEVGLTVYYQNESMLAYAGDELRAMVPDLICAFDSEAVPMTNADLTEGMKLTVVGIPAPEQFRTERAAGMFSNILAALEYGGPYRPLQS